MQSTYPNNSLKSTSSGSTLKDTANDVKDFATSTTSDIADAASTAVRSARDMVKESGDAVAKRFNATSDWVTTAAKENPLRALGLALAAGAAIVLFLGRR